MDEDNSSEFQDLMLKMFEYDPRERITVEEIKKASLDAQTIWPEAD